MERPAGSWLPRLRLCLCLALCVGVATAATADQTGNLIINPGAETGNLTGWFDPSGNGYNLTTTIPFAGVYSFWGGVSGPSGAWSVEVYQDVDVSPYASIIDAGVMNASFSAWGRSNQGGSAIDNGSVIVEYRSSGGILSTYSSGDFRPTNTWVQVTDNRVVPAGTRFVRVRLLANRGGGASSDGGQDELSLRLDSPQLDAPRGPLPFSVGIARPNPTFGSSTLDVTLARETPVDISIIDVRGRLVRALHFGERRNGPVTIRWDGRDGSGRLVSPGLYFYSGHIGEHRLSRPLVVVR